LQNRLQHAAGVLARLQRVRMHRLKQVPRFWISVCMLSGFGFVIGTRAGASPANMRVPTAPRTMA